jgi:hypothetical protein
MVMRPNPCAETDATSDSPLNADAIQHTLSLARYDHELIILLECGLDVVTKDFGQGPQGHRRRLEAPVRGTAFCRYAETTLQAAW